jgi:hypothetical protein
MSEDKPFELKKVIEGARFIFDEALNVWNIEAQTGTNWEAISAHNFLSEEILDIAGLSKQELTLFFGAQGLQRPLPYTTDIVVNPLGGAGLIDIFIASDVPLTNPQGIAPPSVSFTAGFPTSADEARNTKFARGRAVVQSTSAPITMVESDTWDFGSNSPTASDKLYLYRWILITSVAGIAVNGNFIFVPDVRYIANGVATKEKELVHINRLRNSYEQQQRV